MDSLIIAFAMVLPSTAVVGFALLLLGAYHPTILVAVLCMPIFFFRIDSCHVGKPRIAFDIETLSIILILIFFLYFSYWFPFTPIFNMDHYAIMDLSRYFANNKILPPWTTENLFPTATRTIIYPQNIIMAFWGSINYWVYHDDIFLIKSTNIICWIYLANALLIVKRLTMNNKRVLFFLVMLLSVPHWFSAFGKTFVSDTFQVFYSIFFMFLIIETFIEKKYKLIPLVLMLVGISVYIRIFLCGYFVFFLGLTFFTMYFGHKNFTSSLISKYILSTRNIACFLIAFIILISWPMTMWFKYDNPMMPHSSSVANFRYNLANELDVFNNAMMNANYINESRFEQIKNALTKRNIYYKTYTQNDGNSTPVKIQTLLSSYLFLITATVISVFVFYNMFFRNRKNKMKLMFFATWTIIPIFLWFFLDKKMATVKYFISSIPAWCMWITCGLSGKLKGKYYKIFWPIVLVLIIRLSLIEIIPKLEVLKKDGPFPNWETVFRAEYFNKIDFIKQCRYHKVDTKNSILLLRGEHGGFITYFLGKQHIWEYNWYENPIFKGLHEAKSREEIISYLKVKQIKYIVSMNEPELNRFYLDAFTKTSSVFKEILVSMIIKGDKRFVSLYKEEKAKGLELELIEIKDI
ncbi:MAG: hypothetical protein HQK49_13085 [Oligoflexia bacterium]|nr:hypothetical protein [Oligoflexia bacterium]